MRLVDVSWKNSVEGAKHFAAACVLIGVAVVAVDLTQKAVASIKKKRSEKQSKHGLKEIEE